MSLKFVLGLKEVGGVALLDPKIPINITKGSHLKLSMIVLDNNSKPVTITSYTIKARFKKADATILEITHVAVDNVKGETEFTLTAEDTESLFVGQDQSIEFEVYKTATPTIKAYFHQVKAITVADKILL